MSTMYTAPKFFGINPYQYISENEYHAKHGTIPMLLNNSEIGYAVMTKDPTDNSRMLTCVFFDQQHAKKRHEGELEYSLRPQMTVVDGREMFFFETIDFFENQ